WQPRRSNSPAESEKIIPLSISHCGEEDVMNETGVDIVRILEICRDVEVYVSELYYFFEESFRDTPDMGRLWKKTAMEEEDHAKQFVLAINLRKQDLVHDVSIDQESAEAVLN